MHVKLTELKSERVEKLSQKPSDVQPSLVEACIAAASTISESTQKEFFALSSVQQERREQDASDTTEQETNKMDQQQYDCGYVHSIPNTIQQSKYSHFIQFNQVVCLEKDDA